MTATSRLRLVANWTYAVWSPKLLPASRPVRLSTSSWLRQSNTFEHAIEAARIKQKPVSYARRCERVKETGFSVYVAPMPTEPKFIRDARRAIEQEAEGRPDSATYAEAGNAALNMVLAHYLATPMLNPGLVAIILPMWSPVYSSTF